MTEHDSWLTRDYDRRLDEEFRYEAALEAETLRQHLARLSRELSGEAPLEFPAVAVLMFLRANGARLVWRL